MRGFVLPMTVALAAAAPGQQVTPAPLTSADSDRITPVQVGQILTVELRQSAGTRSNWRMVPAKGLAAVGAPAIVSQRNNGAPIVGGPQLVIFHVRVTGTGELALTFVDAHTFGGPDQQARTATFILEAK